MSAFLDQDDIPSIRDAEVLREAVAGRSREVAPKPALRALVELAGERPGHLVADLLDDPSTSLDTRTAIAAALGADPSVTSRATLLRAVGSGEPTLSRRAALSLGRVGEPEDLEALADIRLQPNSPADAAVAFARRLISYRLGLGSHRFRAPAGDDVVPVTAEPAEVSAEPLGDAELAEAQEVLRVTLPDVLLAPAGVSLSCRGADVWVVPTRVAVGDSAGESLTERDAVAAVVFRRSGCPGGVYPTTFVLSHPTRNGVAFIGVSTTGLPLYAGTIDSEGRVRVGTLDTPRTIPFELEAVLDTAAGRLEIVRAVAARRRSAGRRGPQAVS